MLQGEGINENKVSGEEDENILKIVGKRSVVPSVWEVGDKGTKKGRHGGNSVVMNQICHDFGDCMKLHGTKVPGTHG